MQTSRIEDVTEFVLDGTHGSPERTESGIPVLSAQNVKNGRLMLETERFTSEAEYEKFQSHLPLSKGDVLLTIVGTIGRAAVVEDVQPLVFQRSVAVLRPKNNCLDSRFLFHVTQSREFQAQLTRSVNKSSQAGVYLGKLKKLLIPLPPLEKQKRIADILDRAETLRAKRRAALDQFDELSKSIFTEMFGDPLKNPMGWSTINLEDICSIITDGEHATPKRTESGIYLLSARNIQNHSLSLDNVDFIDKDEYDRISKRIIPQKGDILVSCSGTIGRVAQVKECFKFQLVRSVALLRPETSKVNPTYLEYNFDSIYLKKQIEKSVNQSSQANLFQGKIRKLKIPLPPLEIQDKFAEVAGQLEKIKQSHQQSLLEINNLLDSLTHEAFTGKLTSNQLPERQMGNGESL